MRHRPSFRGLIFSAPLGLFLTACATTAPVCSVPIAAKTAGDDSIRRIENCVCYKSKEAQNLPPWELGWDDPEKLRKQISHCECQAHIDVKDVNDPRRYVVKGTIVK